ncbi:MAG: S49 family peptidase [Gammaproteobacteria bacterium]
MSQNDGEFSANTRLTDDQLARSFAFEALAEQRRSRRWGNFFKFLFISYLLAFLALSWPNLSKNGVFGADKITALVEVNGVIAPESDAGADFVVTGLRDAFKDEKTAGVILRINSPGGSPVQSGYINDEITRLKQKHPEIPVYAVIQDICASGGYYIAVAADKIYANEASIVGSIGVRMDGFGFVDAMDKLGIERRLLTAGESKGALDPFSPLSAKDVDHVRRLLGQIHEQFIATVKQGRGDRLVENKDLFSGLFWTGEESKALGLIDEFGSASYVAREIIKAEDIVNFTPRRDVFEQFSKRLGAELAARLTSAIPSFK